MLSLSVVIPAFNSAATIGAALDSVCGQEGVGEVIVVDDASTDDTVAVVDRWRGEAGAGVACRIVRLNSNMGPAGARNAGMKEATGEWIAFLDADDRWLKGKLALQRKLIGLFPDAGLICGKTKRLMPGEAGEVKNELQGRMVGLEEFAVSNPVATSTVIARRALLLECGGFDGKFRGPEDYDLWMRFAARNGICICGTELAEYRVRPGSLSMDDRTFLPQVMNVLEKAFSAGGVFSSAGHLRNAAMANQYWNAAWMAFCRGSRRTAVEHLWRSFRYDSGSVRKSGRRWVPMLFRYVFGRVGDE